MKKLVACLILSCFLADAKGVAIGDRVEIKSELLDKSHELLVYTPPSYDFNKEQKFPVLYLVDGDYNFHYVTGLIELWSNISAFMPEMVVVGISGGSTENFRGLMKPPLKPSPEPESGKSDVGHADVMLQALKNEIMPHVQRHYRVNEFDVLGGHSMGGLFVTYASVHEPQLFNRFIAVSPSLWWQSEIMKTHVADVLDKNLAMKSNLYLTLANEQGMGVHGFIEMLQSKRRGDFLFKFKQFPDETHGSVGLASYQWALFDVFEVTRLPERYFESANDVVKHAALLKKTFGLTMPIPSGFLRNSCYAWCGDKKVRTELDDALFAHFPGDVAFFRVLVAAHLLAADKDDEALNWLEKAKKIAPDYVAIYHVLTQLYLKQGDNEKVKEAKGKLEALLSTQSIRQWQRNEMKLD